MAMTGLSGITTVTLALLLARAVPMPQASAPTASAVALPDTQAASAEAYAGKWVLSVAAGQTIRTFDLDLTVVTGKITGKLLIDHAGLLDIQRPRFEDGVLAFFIPNMEKDRFTEFTMRLGADGSVTGHMEGPMGKLPLTGKRPDVLVGLATR